MNFHRSLLVLAVAVGVGTLSAQMPSDSAKEIAAIRDQWVSNWNAQKLEPIVELYAKGAVLLPATGERIRGRDAIEKYLRDAMVSSAGDLTVTSVTVRNSGNLAFDSGSFQYTRKGGGTTIAGGATIGGGTVLAGGGQRQVKGSDLIVLGRGSDGKWLIEQHASTEVPPATQ